MPTPAAASAAATDLGLSPDVACGLLAALVQLCGAGAGAGAPLPSWLYPEYLDEAARSGRLHVLDAVAPTVHTRVALAGAARLLGHADAMAIWRRIIDAACARGDGMFVAAEALADLTETMAGCAPPPQHSVRAGVLVRLHEAHVARGEDPRQPCRRVAQSWRAARAGAALPAAPTGEGAPAAAPCLRTRARTERLAAALVVGGTAAAAAARELCAAGLAEAWGEALAAALPARAADGAELLAALLPLPPPAAWRALARRGVLATLLAPETRAALLPPWGARLFADAPAAALAQLAVALRCCRTTQDELLRAPWPAVGARGPLLAHYLAATGSVALALLAVRLHLGVSGPTRTAVHLGPACWRRLLWALAAHPTRPAQPVAPGELLECGRNEDLALLAVLARPWTAAGRAYLAAVLAETPVDGWETDTGGACEALLAVELAARAGRIDLAPLPDCLARDLSIWAEGRGLLPAMAGDRAQARALRGLIIDDHRRWSDAVTRLRPGKAYAVPPPFADDAYSRIARRLGLPWCERTDRHLRGDSDPMRAWHPLTDWLHGMGPAEKALGAVAGLVRPASCRAALRFGASAETALLAAYLAPRPYVDLDAPWARLACPVATFICHQLSDAAPGAAPALAATMRAQRAALLARGAGASGSLAALVVLWATDARLPLSLPLPLPPAALGAPQSPAAHGAATRARTRVAEQLAHLARRALRDMDASGRRALVQLMFDQPALARQLSRACATQAVLHLEDGGDSRAYFREFVDGLRTEVALPDDGAARALLAAVPSWGRRGDVAVPADVLTRRGGAAVHGRTLHLSDPTRPHVAVKFAKAGADAAGELACEARMAHVVERLRPHLGLRSPGARPRALAGRLLAPAIGAAIGAQARDGAAQRFTLHVACGTAQTLVFDAPGNYHLHLPELDDFAALRRASLDTLHDLGALASGAGLVPRAPADLFHNTDAFPRRYLWNVDATEHGSYWAGSGRSVRRTGAGRLGCWPAAVAFVNMGPALRDTKSLIGAEALMALGEGGSDGVPRPAHASLRAALVAAMGDALLAWVLAVGRWHRDHAAWRQARLAELLEAGTGTWLAAVTGRDAAGCRALVAALVDFPYMARQMHATMRAEAPADAAALAALYRGRVAECRVAGGAASWRHGGRGPDLGPFNGPFPLTELIKMLYLVTELALELRVRPSVAAADLAADASASAAMG